MGKRRPGNPPIGAIGEAFVARWRKRRRFEEAQEQVVRGVTIITADGVERGTLDGNTLRVEEEDAE